MVFKTPISGNRSRTDIKMVLATPAMAISRAIVAIASTITRAVEINFMMVCLT